MDNQNPNNLVSKDLGNNKNPIIPDTLNKPSIINQNNSTPPVDLKPAKVVAIKNNSQITQEASSSLPPQIKNSNTNSSKAVKTDFYADLNKLPTNPNVNLLSQSTPFTPVNTNQSQDSILAPARPSAAEAHYLYSSGNKVVTQSENNPPEGIVPSISNIYSSLQSEAEKSEAVALRGSGIGSYFYEDESIEKENIYADVFVTLFTLLSFIVLILPAFNLMTDFIKLLFFPTLLFIIVSVLISAAFKINNWVATAAFATLIVQLLISVIIIIRVFGIFVGNMPILTSYLSQFYL